MSQKKENVKMIPLLKKSKCPDKLTTQTKAF